MRKLTSLLLSLLLVFALATTAFAAQEGTLTGGSITIDNAVVGQTYNAYQILYLESYNKDTNAYAYKANSEWADWLATKTTYVSIDDQGYVTWVKDADAAAFAKDAQTYATTAKGEGVNVSPVATKTADSTTVTFTDLKLGYYLVDSTLGTLCSLDTTNPSVTIKEKNEVPTIEKEVKEDSTGNYGDSNTAQIGDTVEFKTTVHAKKGAIGYVVHDKMSEGLTLNKDSIQVAGATKEADYKVAFDLNDGCDFEITFTQAYLDKITADTDIVITYTAILNDKAVISTGANTNDTKLNYGDESKYATEWAQTKTYTFMFDIVKTDANKKLLSGAEFELYDAQTGGNKIALVKESNGNYRVATDAEKKAEGFTSAVIEAGKATVKGLDANTTYWLEETKAPDGYNKLAGRVEVKIVDSNLTTTMTGDTWAEGNGGVQITNNTGTELPSTGGMGTTIFYILGSVLVLAAGVLLVTKKRMSAEN